MNELQFEAFPKIARLKRELIITEKLDGTNAQVAIFSLATPELFEAAKADPYCIALTHGKANGDVPTALYVGSRTRWIAPEGMPGLGKGCDNFGFARWVVDNLAEIEKLGHGRHYGEWYGGNIQRGYGLTEKRFALFNTGRWGAHNPETPACCKVVTRLNTQDPDEAIAILRMQGSQHVPGWMAPEGIVVYHTASRTQFKMTLEKDAEGKERPGFDYANIDKVVWSNQDGAAK